MLFRALGLESNARIYINIDCPASARPLVVTMSRTALITGGTGLLGRAVVKAFEGSGWKVIATGYTRASPPRILKLDVLNEAEVARTLDEVK